MVRREAENGLFSILDNFNVTIYIKIRQYTGLTYKAHINVGPYR